MDRGAFTAGLAAAIVVRSGGSCLRTQTGGVGAVGLLGLFAAMVEEPEGLTVFMAR